MNMYSSDISVSIVNHARLDNVGIVDNRIVFVYIVLLVYSLLYYYRIEYVRMYNYLV